MGGSYRQCVECGKRALSIATRCPGCGCEFPAPAAPEDGPAPELRRFLSPRVATGVLVAAAILMVASPGLGSRPLEQASTVVSAGSTVASSDAAPSDAAPSDAAPSDAAESGQVGAEVAYAMPATARRDTARATAPAVASRGELLVARTWTHVRKSRSRSSDLEAVLLPGDTVVADSLERLWYRVALEGEVLGYVHRSTLMVPGERAEPSAAPEAPAWPKNLPSSHSPVR
jgi:hypothetical protein